VGASDQPEVTRVLQRVTIPNSYAPERQITVYVPAGHDPAVPARLLILHDGQNLFEPERAHVPGQHWRVAETAAELIEAGQIPPIVIAGVDHAGDERGREMTPTAGNVLRAGGAGIYGRFVMGEMVPYLAREFGVRTDPDGIAMGGASLGGLVTLTIARQFPGRIGRLLVMSPSVWWDNHVILRRLRRVGLSGRPRVWLDIGRREGAQTVTDTRLLRDVLIWQTSALKYVEDPDGRHSETDWARRLPAALTWLYAPERTAHDQ
jgi:enterochelin esterase-like enzyme